MQKIAHCFCVPPAAVRKRRLRKCGGFFCLFLGFFFSPVGGFFPASEIRFTVAN